MTHITGHRGARNLWPENSLTGFRNVLSMPVEAIEFDVHLTDAGELVVIHDPTLDRTTEGTGPVRLLPPEARREIRLKGSAEKIPTLADVLTVLASSDRKLHIELKANEIGDPYPEIVERVTEEIDRFGIADRTYLTSFDTLVLQACREHAPQIPRLVSVNAHWAARQGGLKSFLARVDDLVEIIAIHHELLDEQWELVSSLLPLHRLCVWTLNDADLIRKWLDRGVGHLTTDSPDLALQLRAEALLYA